jgi:cell division protein FtsZ
MQYIQSLCDPVEANIFFGTVIDPEMEGTVRVTVLATGFEPETPEARRVAEAAGKLSGAVPTPGPVAAQPSLQVMPNPISSADVLAQARERIARQQNPEPSQVFEDDDLDIPAFIREHRNRQQEK